MSNATVGLIVGLVMVALDAVPRAFSLLSRLMGWLVNKISVDTRIYITTLLVFVIVSTVAASVIEGIFKSMGMSPYPAQVIAWIVCLGGIWIWGVVLAHHPRNEKQNRMPGPQAGLASSVGLKLGRLFGRR